MTFRKNSSPTSSSSSSSSVVDEMPEMALRNTSHNSSDDDDSFGQTHGFVKHQMLLNKISDLQYRAQERQEEFQSLLERFNYIHESLEWEIEKVEKSMISMEWLEDLQNTIDEFQANMAYNVSRLRENLKKMQEVASKKVLTVKPKGKSGKDLDAKVVKSIQSLSPCPTVAELKENSTAASVYSSNLISVLNSITKSTSCSPATSKALKLSAATIENLNKAFQDHCLEIKILKTESKVTQDVNRYISVPPVHQNGSKVPQKMVQTFPAFPAKPKADDFAYTQVKEPVRETKVKVLPQERPVVTSDTAPKDLRDGPFPPAPARTFALRKITQSVKETKVTVEKKASITSFEETMETSIRPSALPQLSQSVEEPKIAVEIMERTKTLFEETLVQKDLQSSSPRSVHRPSLDRSFALPQVSQAVKERKVHAVHVEERQGSSTVHTRLPSAVKLPRIQTEVKPSLQKSDKPETSKIDSAVSGSTEEHHVKNSEEDRDNLLHASMKHPSFVIDIQAQENNLQQLDRAFQNNDISSELYNLCRGTVHQTLKSVELRLGCLLQRYIKHVQLKQLRKTLDGHFKATRDLKNGLEFKKVHSQLCKFDRFQQRVNNIWDAKQASTDETRRLCIARTAHLYQQVNAAHGLHLTGISCAQRHVSLPLLTVTPVRFRPALCPSPPPDPKTAPSRVRPACHLRIHPALPRTNVTRNIPGSSLKISPFQCRGPDILKML